MTRRSVAPFAPRPIVRWPASIAVLLIVLCAAGASSQTLPADAIGDSPTFKVQIWGHIEAEFSARVWSYYQLRLRLQEGLRLQTVTNNVAEIWRGELKLAHRIRVAREGAKEGDIFTPASTIRFKQVLLLVMNAKTWAVIMDDNPGEFSHRINGNYPKARTLSTMPYGILSQLPPLPDGIEYRFLGRHLVLHDTRANVILDRIRYAIQCTACDS
jgi:hypothetical protein